MELTLEILPYQISICQLTQASEIPSFAAESRLLSITRTPEELSIVCESSLIPQGTTADHSWVALRVVGPLDLSLIGILADLSNLLAEADISIFSISTYETDIMLIKSVMLPEARKVLETSHRIIGG